MCKYSSELGLAYFFEGMKQCSTLCGSRENVLLDLPAKAANIKIEQVKLIQNGRQEKESSSCAMLELS